MSKPKPPPFDPETFDALIKAASAPSIGPHEFANVTLPDGESVLVVCNWRSAWGVVFVIRAPSSGYAETHFAKIGPIVKGESETRIPPEWRPVPLGDWLLPYHVKNNTPQSWSIQLKEALRNAGDVRRPNVPDHLL